MIVVKVGDSRGKRGKAETPQAKPRRLSFLPAGKRRPARKSTVAFNRALKIKVGGEKI